MKTEINSGYPAKDFRMAFFSTDFLGKRVSHWGDGRVGGCECFQGHKAMWSSGIMGGQGGCVSQGSCAMLASHPEFTHRRRNITHTH